MEKEEIIKRFENEKWYPMKPTNDELHTSQLLNNILDDIIARIQKEL